ncbi:MAG: ABC transporter ATP-binding protein [Hylemonella sp.]
MLALPLLDIKNLSVDIPTRHGVLHALKNIDLHIDAGEILGVVGESGAGKSLTGAAILDLLEPPGRVVGGEIRLSGERISGLSPQAMREIRGKRIGAIFQDPLTSLNPLYSVGHQLIQTILTHLPMTATQARQKSIELLEDTGIPAAAERLDQYPHQFSGGMRQRVVIALALAAEPELIIADEPTTALDVSIQAQIIELLVRVCRQHHAAVLLITHDMGVIAETSDRVAVMYAGRVVETGAVEQIIERPRHPYTRGLMDSIPRAEAQAERLQFVPGHMPRLSDMPDGCAFHPRCDRAVDNCSSLIPPLNTGPACSQLACWNPLLHDSTSKEERA